MGVRALLDNLRHGRDVAPDALAAFARGLADGTVSDAQAGAFAMAVCTGPGLGEAGRVALTRAMADSGDRLAWPDAPGPVVDKHSTGGVGDAVSLVLAPMLAACGAAVPMISGRGLGHTGGTLDKLDAIPGLSVEQDEDGLRRIVDAAGCAIVAASVRVAPADRRLYAIRDQTGTVDQIDLITASILSKKLAAGLGALVLDVKVGSGAFMRDIAAARDLARALVATANGAGCPTAALLTDMDRPVAPACGNALEVAAAMEVLEGGGGRLADLSVALGARVLALAGIDAPETRLRAALASGGAMDRFGRMVAAQGGPVDFADRWRGALSSAPVVREVPAPVAGHVARIDGTALGRIVIALGGGREVPGARIDPAVGLDRIARLGDRVEAGAPLARIHAADADAADRAAAAVLAAIHVGDARAVPPLIHEEAG
ncbi:thymidine phosphorylase [Oceaniovalibus guishaninsula JLT2003]|uniref:Thymidine phosphorylase n=1 Tax=Oceaniovalibus guishaninsula JLT2003 TaxID=1231392 RepID=K2HE02_9RHOB|nr:thymidine phosphorylase [Oceaniovalibus guishaninsula]EKE44767.1 thymidine phosphorylase [Oceaniovalibus guishaninsula JLT2003]